MKVIILIVKSFYSSVFDAVAFCLMDWLNL